MLELLAGGGVDVVLVDPEEDEEDDDEDDDEVDVAEVMVVVPLAPLMIVNAPDSGNEPTPPLRGSMTTW